MAPGVGRSAVSLLTRAITAIAAGGISSGARVVAAVVVVGHGLFLSMFGGEVISLKRHGRGGRSGRGGVSGWWGPSPCRWTCTTGA